MRNIFIQGAAKKLGIQDEFDPDQVDNETLMQLVAAKQALEPRGSAKFEQSKVKGLEGYVFDPSSGKFSVDEKLKSQIDKTKLLAEKPGLTVANVSSINKDLTALTKPSREIKAAAASLVSLEKSSSPTDQLAAIFKFMKSLDPTSVVREGEQQMARSTGGPADAFVGYINRIRGEGGLTEEAFKNMVNSAKLMANSSIESARDESRSFLDVFTELTPERRGNLDKRVPLPFTIDKTAKRPAGSGMKAEFDALPDLEKQKVLQQLTDEEKEALGI
jgi:hypothetical protein